MWEEETQIEIATPTEPEDEQTGGVPIVQQLVLVSSILLLVFGTALTPRFISGLKGAQDNQPANVPYTTVEVDEATLVTQAELPDFAALRLAAEAVYVWDLKNQRALYKQAASDALPLASVTKLMTALLAHEILQPESAIYISDAAIAEQGDSGLTAGETFTRGDLNDLVLMASSNDGAYALAESAGQLLDRDDPVGAFVAAMNARAQELDLTSLHFKNPTGLDISTTEVGAVGSAREVSFLMEYIIATAPELLTQTQARTERIYNDAGEYHEAENTNDFVADIPGLIGSKTGYTDLAGGNLVVAYDAGLNRPVIITVLGSTQWHRFTDVMQLIDVANAHVSQTK